MVQFRQQDIRRELPDTRFPLVLCRNLVFTYFADDVQRQVLGRLVEHLAPGGVLVVGKKEILPEVGPQFGLHDAGLGIYRIS